MTAEARWLHFSLFGFEPTQQLIDRYNAAHSKLFGAEPSSLMQSVVQQRLDVEAVEFALRLRGEGKELTRSVHVLCYLVESQAAYCSYFFSRHGQRGKAFLDIPWALLRSVFLYGKGRYLIRRHGLN